ncbi:FapA family protein [Bacillus alkalicellulosilyticus]|uniref:FapA family protein n=1 Tax=Alkalihalobacterium alkalicellulosilyticum TaxID=1912214 RepID=UPI000996DE86|nr:FapA family protein [Bacillus alkalicellulosilyticus]
MGKLDGLFEVTIANNKMSATITKIEQIPNDCDWNKDEILDFLKNAKISHGIKEEVIQHMVSDPHNVSFPVVIASGQEPVNGKDAYLKAISVVHEKQNLTMQDKINFKELNTIPVATKGQVVGEKIEATKGVPGFNVMGEPIVARPGKDIKLKPGKNVELSNDGKKLIAQTDGQLTIEKKTIHVFEVYEVNGDVGMKTGNLSFIGSITIKGNVPTGFKVKADGDIRIYGTVEGADLEAGGSIFVSAGILGQGNGRIFANGDLHTKFVSQANIQVEGDIFVEQTILHSTCSAGGKVDCTKGKGIIVGGSISAGTEILAKDIGNDMNTRTPLFIGVTQATLEREKQARKTLEQSKQELEKLTKLLQVFEVKEKQGLTLAANERIMKLRIRNTYAVTNENIDDFNDELTELQEKMQAQLTGKVAASQTIYPNASVTFGKYRKKFTVKHDHIKIVLNDGEVKVLPL